MAGLLRPEVWPFLALYAGWLLWREPSQWRVIVPVLTAQQLALAMGQVGNAVILPVWVAAAVCAVWATHRREARGRWSQ